MIVVWAVDFTYVELGFSEVLMVVVYSGEELMFLVGSDGAVSRNVKLAAGLNYYGLEGLYTLKGVELAPSCKLFGLCSIESVAGVFVPDGCELHDLRSVESMSGAKMASGSRLWGLSKIRSLEGVAVSSGCWLEGLESVESAEDILTWPDGVVFGGLSEQVAGELRAQLI